VRRIVSDSPLDSTASGQPLARHFTRLFAATLAIVAALLTGGQVVTQLRLKEQINVIKVVRVAALQRTKSQQIAKNALRLTAAETPAEYRAILGDLRTIFEQFNDIHHAVRVGELPGRNIKLTYSDSVRTRYQELEPFYQIIHKTVSALLKKAESADGPATLNAEPELTNLLQYENRFLQRMDAIIQQHNRETLTNLSNMEDMELYLYSFTLLGLVLIGWFILLPTLRKLRQAIEQLVAAENRTATANRKLLSINRILKETRQQLFDATRQQYQQQMDEQKLRTFYLMSGQEEERKRLSRELHDGIGQMLTAIKLQVESLDTSLKKNGQELPNMNPLKSLITQTIQEARNVSNNLMPTVLSDFGLIPALKMLADTQAENSPIEVIFHTNLADVRFDKNTEIGLYRITQEAVSNAIRHAKPHQITIELFEKDNFLHLLVFDDGKGFRTPRQRRQETVRTSQGIHNMQERAALLNGRFKINSAPDKGTKVQVSLPYKPANPAHEYHQTNAGR